MTFLICVTKKVTNLGTMLLQPYSFSLFSPQIVDMIREFLHLTESSKNETEELERLAGQLSLSETPEQVGEREWRGF